VNAQAAPVINLEDVRTRARGPVHIRVLQAELVERLCDFDALATEATHANGAAIQNLLRMPSGPERDEAMRATHATHNRLVELLKAIRMANGVYDTKPRTD
jgi:erythromycin esterase-like protein